MLLLKELDSACCGCSVKAVSRFFLWFGIICGILYVAQTRSPQKPTQQDKEDLEKSIQDTFGTDPKEAERQADVWIEIMQKTSVATLTDVIINIICCGLALYGSYKSRGGFMVPYLVLNGINLISVAVVIVLLSILGFFYLILYRLVIVLLISFGISYYSLLVVYSHYSEIKKGQHTPATRKYSV